MANEIKTTTLLRREDGYNVCPQCGKPAYIVMNEYEYAVGCLNCGLRRGLSYPIEDVYDDESTERVRHNWNTTCLASDYYEDAMKVLGVSNGSYVLTNAVDNSILRVFDSFADVKKFVSADGDRSAFGVYVLVNGGLQYLGSSYLIWLYTSS